MYYAIVNFRELAQEMKYDGGVGFENWITETTGAVATSDWGSAVVFADREKYIEFIKDSPSWFNMSYENPYEVNILINKILSMSYFDLKSVVASYNGYVMLDGDQSKVLFVNEADQLAFMLAHREWIH